MILRHFLTEANESNAFIVACEETREALMVDAGDFDPAIADFLDEQGLRLTTVFITHDHYDHTGGLAAAAARDGATVLASGGRPGGVPAQAVHHGDAVHVGTLTGNVLATPGHTPDSVSLAFPGHVFTGDALFAGSVGGTASSSAARRQLDHLRENILSLPPDTEIHTGHGPSSTVAIESRYNPFLV
jgi:hydroxyacylglutathione hydrolase